MATVAYDVPTPPAAAVPPAAPAAAVPPAAPAAAVPPAAPAAAVPPVPPAASRSGRWLAVAAVVWAVIVAAAGYVSAGRDQATAREQTSVAQARPAVNRAVAGLVTAAGPDTVVAVSPFTRLETCRISAARDGERWEQAIVFYTQAGGEGPLLDRLATGLPADSGARARHSDNGRHTLRADAGDFVSVSGAVVLPGEVRVAVATGCRTGTAEVASSEPDSATRAPVAAAFAALRVPPAKWRGYEVPCESGGALRVVTAESEPGAAPGPLPSGLMSVAPGSVVAQPELYAYRTGSTSVVARMRDGVVAVTATTPCA